VEDKVMVLDFANLRITAKNKLNSFDGLIPRIQSASNTPQKSNEPATIKNLTLKNFIADSFENLDFTFSNSEVERLEFINCSFAGVEKAVRMFKGCSKLREITVDGVSVAGSTSQLGYKEQLTGLFPNVTDVFEIFSDCIAIKHLNLEPLFGSTCSVKGWSTMLIGDTSLETINFGGIKFTPQIEPTEFEIGSRSRFFGLYNPGIRYSTSTDDKHTLSVIKSQYDEMVSYEKNTQKYFESQDNMQNFFKGLANRSKQILA